MRRKRAQTSTTVLYSYPSLYKKYFTAEWSYWPIRIKHMATSHQRAARTHADAHTFTGGHCVLLEATAGTQLGTSFPSAPQKPRQKARGDESARTLVCVSECTVKNKLCHIYPRVCLTRNLIRRQDIRVYSHKIFYQHYIHLLWSASEIKNTIITSSKFHSRTLAHFTSEEQVKQVLCAFLKMLTAPRDFNNNVWLNMSISLSGNKVYWVHIVSLSLSLLD